MLKIAGQRYGRLVAIEQVALRHGEGWLWAFACDCGARVVLPGARVRFGNTSSCGCLHREQVAAQARTHGLSHRPEHNAWITMRRRCEDPKVIGYMNYGGRGISVCERWQVFANFIADMGLRPGVGYSVDRIDNDRGYEPGNCRWATRREQGYNKRTSRVVEINGARVSLAKIAHEHGLPPKILRSRVIRLGWALEHALATPYTPRSTQRETTKETP